MPTSMRSSAGSVGSAMNSAVENGGGNVAAQQRRQPGGADVEDFIFIRFEPPLAQQFDENGIHRCLRRVTAENFAAQVGNVLDFWPGVQGKCISGNRHADVDKLGAAQHRIDRCPSRHGDVDRS